MSETPTKIPTITREEILTRARSCVGRGEYKLGRGGFDPNDAHPWPTGPKEYSDCSGFISWVIAEDRENHAIDGGWIETTNIVSDATGPHAMFALVSGGAIPGDLVVYGDHINRIGAHQVFKVQGHVGVITAVDASGRPNKVVHCSNGNFKSLDHAIAETSEPGVFFRNRAIVVRPKKIVEGVS